VIEHTTAVASRRSLRGVWLLAIAGGRVAGADPSRRLGGETESLEDAARRVRLGHHLDAPEAALAFAMIIGREVRVRANSQQLLEE
jgi:hypothetical protein